MKKDRQLRLRHRIIAQDGCEGRYKPINQQDRLVSVRHHYSGSATARIGAVAVVGFGQYQWSDSGSGTARIIPSDIKWIGKAEKVTPIRLAEMMEDARMGNTLPVSLPCRISEFGS